jgi:pSer/pThr/pTyr-binding forkhead associated (FHA) protein
MYLEVYSESEEPRVFSLEKEENIVGSAASNDVVLENPGISKRHLKIVHVENQWFIIDQGSTNGTYIDNERLIPGRKFEIKPSQFIRLSDVIHISVVEKPESNHVPPKSVARPIKVQKEEKTRVVSLKDLKEAKAAPKIVKKSDDRLNTGKKKMVKKERTVSTKTLVIVAVILIFGYVANKKLTEDLTINKVILESSGNNKAADIIKKSSNAAENVE